MSGRTARLLVALYPPRWRALYGEEFKDLLGDCPATSAIVLDVVRAAVGVHLTFGAAARRAEAVRRLRRRRAEVAALLLLAPGPASVRGVFVSPSRPVLP